MILESIADYFLVIQSMVTCICILQAFAQYDQKLKRRRIKNNKDFLGVVSFFV